MPEQDSTKERILTAAQDLFASNGFDATPTSHIARAADVPKGLVHYYFNRKPDLLVALVQRLPAEPVATADVVIAGDLPGSLHNLVTALDERLERSSLLSHLLWREADTHDTVRVALQRHYLNIVSMITEVITAASPKPLPHKRIDAAAALLAHALSYRHSVARHDGPCGEGTAGMGAELDLVVAGLLTAPAGGSG
jgi:AcrR family transcriptional regulator